MCRAAAEADAATLEQAPPADLDVRSNLGKSCDFAAASEQATLEVDKLDIRVGLVTKAELHPDADSLYVEEVECGEPEPRTIISGLVKFVPIVEMQGRRVMVLCNLKPRNMRGIKSNGMLLCASNEAHDVVEPLMPPAEAQIGERVFFCDGKENQPEPEGPNKVQKKKIWESVQPDLKTNGSKQATYRGHLMMTSAGPVVAASLTDASIS
jgi:methionine--tRNA ligase beta chain